VTVVDAAAFFDDLESIEELADRWVGGRSQEVMYDYHEGSRVMH
jgi:hypothetical protein